MSIKTLKGYLHSDASLMEPGVVIGWEGVPFSLHDFDPSKLTIEMAARQLSRLNRYNGNTKLPYTVAQHTVIGCQTLILCGLVEEAEVFLYHDQSECIFPDLNPPTKKLLGKIWTDLEDEVQRRICEYRGLKFPFDPIIHTIDKNLASFEISMMLKSNRSAEFDYWSEEKSYNQFMLMHDTIHELKGYF